jgi:DHA1 family tetracycline resistance protein-like MFS transporter
MAPFARKGSSRKKRAPMIDQTSEPPAASAKGRSAGLVFILITVWIDVLSWGVTIPVYPRLFEHFTHGDVPAAARLVGVFMTMFALIQLFAAPVLGGLSDRYGRRSVILVACGGLGLDLLAMAWAPNIGWLFVTRIIHAITAASNAAAMAYVADVTAPEKRARAFGLIGAAFGIGFIVGPGLGGLLGQINLRLPFLVGAGLALVNTAYGFFVLPESLPRDRRRPFAIRESNPLGALKFLRADRVIFTLAGVTFLMQLAHQVYPSVWVLYTGYRYNWGPMAVGATLAVSGVLTAIVQTMLIEPTIKGVGERAATMLGLTSWICGHLIMASANTAAMFLAGMPFGALSGLASPALNSILSRRVTADRQGELQGAQSSLQSTTGIIGPTLFTGSFAYAIAPGSSLHLAGAPFYISAALLICALILAAHATAPSRLAGERA